MPTERDFVWLWSHGRFQVAMRWSEAHGRVLERRVFPVGTGKWTLAGWVKQCGLSRVAIDTPDRARLIVHRRRKKLDATGGVEVATLTHLGIVRVLRLVPNRGRPFFREPPCSSVAVIGPRGPYPARMQIRLDRDSVSAGDDVDGHTRVCDVDGRRTLGGLVADLADDGYLPRIQGGSACWIVRDVPRGRPVAVVAVTPDFRTRLHPLDARTTPVVSDVGPTLYFEYQAQRPPDDVIDELRRVPRT